MFSNDSLKALQGSDYLNGGSGDDTLVGGTGNDLLKGGVGDDTYLYNLGDGDDIINDYQILGYNIMDAGMDTLIFGEDITRKDTRFMKTSYGSMEITFKNALNPDDRIRISSSYSGLYPLKVEYYDFADGFGGNVIPACFKKERELKKAA